jgi:hypothetical protein
MSKSGVRVQLIGEDGNAFSIIARVAKALKHANQRELADEFTAKAMKSGGYEALLRLVMEYVEAE